MKKLLLGALAATVLAVLGGVVAQARADKWTVDHKGNWICVDDDSFGGHLDHGDTLVEEGCADD